jgi:nucleotide-binding universal stress UspA family protein
VSAVRGHLDGPVLVGVDGSATSARAVRDAGELAQRLGVELVVVHAVGLMSVIDGEHVPSEGRRDQLTALVDEQWCAPLREIDGLVWRSSLVVGPPAEVLVSQADVVDASLVVVGSRGVGREKLLGSTSHHLVHHCSRPVVVVPPEDRTNAD